MEIRYTGDNIEVTSAMRDYVEKKLHRLQPHQHKITDIHITFIVEKPKQIVKGKIAVPGHQLQASASSENLYESIDKMTDKLMKQLIKYKEKAENHS